MLEVTFINWDFKDFYFYLPSFQNLKTNIANRKNSSNFTVKGTIISNCSLIV